MLPDTRALIDDTAVSETSRIGCVNQQFAGLGNADTIHAGCVGREATEEEIRDLRHTADRIPDSVWIVALVGAAERFAFYAIAAPRQNYLQHGPNDAAVPGALDLGQSLASSISNGVLLFSYLAGLPFAVMSDTWLGRYKTLCISLGLYTCGVGVLLATSLPISLQHNSGIPGFTIAMLLIDLGIGGVRVTISPFLLDQYTNMQSRLLQHKNGELVVAERNLTIQYICNTFYWFTNIAALSEIPATILEKKVGFWAAYLLPFCALWLGLITLVFWGTKNKLAFAAPQGSILSNAARSLMMGAKNGFSLDAARPAYQQEHFHRNVPWDDAFVTEMKQGLIGCRVIFCLTLFYLCYSQASNNLISQAAQMQLHGIPNDSIQALNTVACIVLGPIIQNGLYPFLNKRRIAFGPIARMFAAFLVMASAIAYAACVQRLIYSCGPCYDRPLACAASDDGRIPNSISVWAQTPFHFILAVAEILCFATASEYAYTNAPQKMKALVQALTLLTAGAGSAIGMAISPAAKDPQLVIMYSVLASITGVFAVPFWWLFGHSDMKNNPAL